MQSYNGCCKVDIVYHSDFSSVNQKEINSNYSMYTYYGSQNTSCTIYYSLIRALKQSVAVKMVT